jgi:probable phosphoglycerate mutase
MKIYLVRHGETASNRDRLALGRADPELTPLGRRQAEALARECMERGPIAAVYSSPLLRAHQTARAIAAAHGLEPVLMAELLELDVGETEGLTATELREKHGDFLAEWRGPNAGEVRMPGGESLSDLQSRAWGAIEAMREAHPPEENLVAVTHNFAIHTLVCRALNIPLAEFRRFQQDLASITTIEFRGQRTIVANLNETCHLEGISGEPDW